MLPPDPDSSQAAPGPPAADDARDAERLFPLVYDELRAIARRELARERERPCSTTDLMHEAYLRLYNQTQSTWKSRAHFLGIAARSMRQVLVDFARRRHAAKRGGPTPDATLHEHHAVIFPQVDLILSVDDALVDLAAKDTRLAQVVECRFFGGLTTAEIAEVLEVAPRTVERDWVRARAYLGVLLGPDAAEAGP